MNAARHCRTSLNFQAEKAVITVTLMLVLTRKLGEGIVIDDDVTITIVEMKGGNVRIGIEAPRSKKIYRQEVYNRIVAENREAAQWNMLDLEKSSDNLIVRKNGNGKVPFQGGKEGLKGQRFTGTDDFLIFLQISRSVH